jgi:hypothetical protein
MSHLKITIVVDNVHSTTATDNNTGMYIIHYSIKHMAFSAECTLSTTVILIKSIGTL